MGAVYLQRAANAIIEYFSKWKIRVNADKCQQICFSTERAIPSIAVSINDHRLDWRETIKYLGVRYDRRLTWGPHIHQTVDKVESKMLAIYHFINRHD